MTKISYKVLIVIIALVGIVLGGYWLLILPDSTPTLPPGLSVEEHELKDMPETEPLTFMPLEGTQEEILSRHREEREKRPDRPSPNEATLGEDELIATTSVTTTNEGEKVYVEVSRNGEAIYSIQLGDASCPVPTIWGLWAYDDHWILEVAGATVKKTLDKSIYCDVLGQVIQDGMPLNTQHGYQESFGFQLMNGKPFYFFKREGRWGVSYDNQEIALGYSQIPHYWCCSGSAMNPKSAENMVAFFVQRGFLRPVWYYVEIGVFE